jgi:glycosyltransferase involved in cell wall biosynthesis
MVVFSYYPEDPRPRRAAEALVDEGMSVEVISLKDRVSSATRETFNGVDILRVPLKRRRGGLLGYVLQYGAFLLASSAIVAARSVRRRYDLVYVHNMPDILVLSGLLPKVFGAKVILDLHDPMPELMTSIFDFPKDSLPVRLLERLERWSLRVADVVLTVNLAFEKLFASRSCRADKIRVVMNSPDEKIFGFRRPRGEQSMPRAAGAPFVIMYHGSLVERNGLDLAVDALARVRQRVPSAILKIYGATTPFLDQVMEAARAKGLQEAIEYRGPKRPEGIVEAIEACDVGIIPNRRNIFTELNMPTRIFEYLARGKPVIAPRTAGIQDYFDDESLVFFELGESQDLARKLEYVFFHPRETLATVTRGQDVYLAHAWRQERETLVNVTADLLSPARRLAHGTAVSAWAPPD